MPDVIAIRIREQFADEVADTSWDHLAILKSQDSMDSPDVAPIKQVPDLVWRGMSVFKRRSFVAQHLLEMQLVAWIAVAGRAVMGVNPS